ncbi:MAG TPA: hypothetical protein VF823_04715 [Anaerolineales bacterium]
MKNPIPPWLPAVKGVAASIVLALAFQSGPLRRDQLAHLTGYNRSTLTTGLQALMRLGLVSYLGRLNGWQLTQAAWLPLAPAPAAGNPTHPPLETCQTHRETPAGLEDLRQASGLLTHQIAEMRQRFEDHLRLPGGPVEQPEIQGPWPVGRYRGDTAGRPSQMSKEVEIPTVRRAKREKGLGKPTHRRRRPPEALEKPPQPGPVAVKNRSLSRARAVVVNPLNQEFKSLKREVEISTTNSASVKPPHSPSAAQAGRKLPSRKPRQPVKPRSEPKKARNLAAGLDRGVVQALLGVGIMLNARTRLMAGLPHVTPDYVRGHYARLKTQGLADRTGLLVAILESGAAAPRVYPNGHLATCHCEECSRRYRYLLTGTS